MADSCANDPIWRVPILRRVSIHANRPCVFKCCCYGNEWYCCSVNGWAIIHSSSFALLAIDRYSIVIIYVTIAILLLLFSTFYSWRTLSRVGRPPESSWGKCYRICGSLFCINPLQRIIIVFAMSHFCGEWNLKRFPFYRSPLAVAAKTLSQWTKRGHFF